jgi:hypothetical protein
VPTLSGTIDWPSFGFNFVEPDFSSFTLIGLRFALPDPGGKFPNTRLMWIDPAPSLKFILDRDLSLDIDVDGAPASGKVELERTEILKIAAFKVEGPVDDLKVTIDLTTSASADGPSDDIEVRPLTIAWDKLAVSAVVDTSGLVITTHVGEIAVSETGKADRFAMSLDLVTRYTASGAVDMQVRNMHLMEPTGAQLVAIALREVGFGFGFRYTLAALPQTDRLTAPRDIIRKLDLLSQKQVDLSSFPAWHPELDGERLTLAMQVLLIVTAASSVNVYNTEKERDRAI